jgi:precorrin-2 dehydrogenase/sirohydrochlorin ferrochelatase
MIPLMLDLVNRKVLIFGGGDVGARKAAYFEHEAEVIVISRSFSPALDALAIERQETDLSALPDRSLKDLLKDAFLAVAATSDPRLNDRIGRLCTETGVLFNNAAGEPGDITIPSIIRGRNYLVAISTCGKGPAVSRYLRMQLEAEYADLDRMIDLQDEMRSMLKDTESVQAKRSQVLWSILRDEEIWRALASNYDQARAIAMERYLHA